MPVNEFKAFATGENANVISQAEYDEMAARDVGFETGIARSEQLNKVWRQASAIAHVVAGFIAETNGEDVVDDGNVAALQNKLKSALLTTAAEAIPEASLSISGITKLSNSTDSNSESVAATPKAVKNALTRSLDTIYPVGVVMWFAQNKNPNTLFPGTTWRYLDENKTVRLANNSGTDVLTTGGADSVVISTANLPAHSHSFSATSGSYDYGTKASNSFDYGTKTTSTTDLGTKTSSSFDYGTKTSSSSGAHRHLTSVSYDGSNTPVWSGAKNAGVSLSGSRYVSNYFTAYSSTDGAHTHTLAMGAHSHTIAMGAHSHSVTVGAHTHTVAIGAHTHSVSGTTGNTGQAVAVSTINSYVKLMAWYRIS